MSAMLGTNQAITPGNKSDRPPLRFKYAYSALMFTMHQKRILVTDDANRNFLIPSELKDEFVAWIDDFTGREDQFDTYRLRDC